MLGYIFILLLWTGTAGANSTELFIVDPVHLEKILNRVSEIRTPLLSRSLVRGVLGKPIDITVRNVRCDAYICRFHWRIRLALPNGEQDEVSDFYEGQGSPYWFKDIFQN